MFLSPVEKYSPPRVDHRIPVLKLSSTWGSVMRPSPTPANGGLVRIIVGLPGPHLATTRSLRSDVLPRESP